MADVNLTILIIPLSMNVLKNPKETLSDWIKILCSLQETHFRLKQVESKIMEKTYANNSHKKAHMAIVISEFKI